MQMALSLGAGWREKIEREEEKERVTEGVTLLCRW